MDLMEIAELYVDYEDFDFFVYEEHSQYEFIFLCKSHGGMDCGKREVLTTDELKKWYKTTFGD